MLNRFRSRWPRVAKVADALLSRTRKAAESFVSLTRVAINHDLRASRVSLMSSAIDKPGPTGQGAQKLFCRLCHLAVFARMPMPWSAAFLLCTNFRAPFLSNCNPS